MIDVQMTEQEIVRRYKEAKYKKSQIQILADLNAVSRETISNILRKHNVPFPGNPNLKKQKKEQDEIMTEAETREQVSNIPDIILKQLEEDLERITKEIGLLLEKKIAIENFISERGINESS